MYKELELKFKTFHLAVIYLDAVMGRAESPPQTDLPLLIVAGACLCLAGKFEVSFATERN
jgi:hypothetical protein